MKNLFAILLLFIGTSLTQDLTNDHLQVFEGSWTGTLTYLNYGDDETLVTLPVELEATFSKSGLDFVYLFTEPGGSIERRTGGIKLSGKKVYYSGKWELVGAEITDLNHWSLELIKTGKDNNRKSDFKQTMEVSPEKITVTKMVKYQDEGDFFMRNQYVFKR